MSTGQPIGEFTTKDGGTGSTAAVTYWPVLGTFLPFSRFLLAAAIAGIGRSGLSLSQA